MKQPNLMKVCAAALCLVFAGCGGTARPRVHNANLLFDPQPGFYNAQQFAGRDLWPVAPSSFDDGEITYYRERFHDYQGDGFHGRDYFRRRFTSVRKGSSHR